MSDPSTIAEKLAAMEQCVCFNLRWVTRLITQHFDHKLRQCGVRPTQVSILAGLAARESTTMAAMADWLGMDRTTLVRNLGPLTREKWVEAFPVPDAKYQGLRLTAAGRRKLLEIHPVWEEAQNEIVATLGTGRWAALLGDLAHATELLAGGKEAPAENPTDDSAYAHSGFSIEFD